MKRAFLFFLCLALLLAAGCRPDIPGAQPPVKQFPTRTGLPANLPTAISTMVPETTSTSAAAGYPAASPSQTATQPAQAAQTAYPAAVPSATATAQTAQALAPGSTPTAGAPAVTAAPAAPFHDCARTPGLVGCAADAIPLKARLAFVDRSTGRLIVVDLETGQGWQAPLAPGAEPGGLDWSVSAPSGSPQLLAGLGNNQYDLFSADGRLLETFTSEETPTWQPGGVLSRDGSVRSEAGDEARLEQTADMHWQLHVKTSAGGERTLPLDSNPGDILYLLRAWVPGMQTLLAQSYFADNQAMTQGGQLITIDAATGAIQKLNASMSLNSDLSSGALFAWDPVQPDQMAFLETSQSDVTAPNLALLDFKTGRWSYPLSDGVAVSGMSWRPDGRLTFAASEVNFANQPQQGQYFHGPGIYLLDIPSGKIDMLVQTPQSATDTWPQWTTDGQTLVYARAISTQAQPSGPLTVQVRARRLSDGKDWVLVEGLSTADMQVRPGFAQKILAFTKK